MIWYVDHCNKSAYYSNTMQKHDTESLELPFMEFLGIYFSLWGTNEKAQNWLNRREEKEGVPNTV